MAIAKKFLSVLLGIILIFAPIPETAYGVYGGLDATGTDRVVGIMDKKDSKLPGCSGSLLTERIVLTAAHCLAKTGKYPGVLAKAQWSYWVTQPGVDTTRDDLNSRVPSSYVVISDAYTNSYDPKNNDYLTTIHDIGFIFLSLPIKISSYPKIASESEVLRLKAAKAIITHYGYGLSDQGVQTGKPNKVELTIRPRERSYEINNFVPESFSIITDEIGTKALCGGDSGGPWYANLDGNLLIVANTVGASGCGGPGSGSGGTFGTLVHQYETLLWQKWDYFMKNETDIRSAEESAKLKAESDAAIALAKLESEKSIAIENGQFYRETTGCHSNHIVAYLQSNRSGKWDDVASVKDWFELSSTCFQPWTIYRAIKGELLRWRLASPNVWEVFTSPFNETTSEKEIAKAKADKEAAKAASDVINKANAETDAASKAASDKQALEKAVADAKSETEAAAQKKLDQVTSTLYSQISDLQDQIKALQAQIAELLKPKPVTVVCTKGNTFRLVKGLNPNCPAGYKKQS